MYQLVWTLGILQDQEDLRYSQTLVLHGGINTLLALNNTMRQTSFYE